MTSPPPTAEPPHERLVTSTKNWTALSSIWVSSVGRETRALLPVAVHSLRMTLVLVVLSGVIFPLLVLVPYIWRVM